MPIRVLHTPVAAGVGIAENVGAFNTQRQLNDESLRQQSFGLDQQQFAADVGYRQAALRQQAFESQQRARLEQQQLEQQDRQFQDQVRGRYDIEALRNQGDLQRAALQGQYGVDRANVTGQYGVDRANVTGQHGLNRTLASQQGQSDRLMQKLTADAEADELERDFKAWALERGHELKLIQGETAQQYRERTAGLMHQHALERQARQHAQQQNIVGQQIQSREGIAAGAAQGRQQQAQQAQQAAERSQKREQQRVKIDQLRTQVGYWTRQGDAQKAAAAQQSLNDAFEEMHRLTAPVLPQQGAPPPVMPPQMTPQQGYGGMQQGPPAGAPAGQPAIGQTVIGPDGRQAVIVGYTPDGRAIVEVQ